MSSYEDIKAILHDDIDKFPVDLRERINLTQATREYGKDYLEAKGELIQFYIHDKS